MADLIQSLISATGYGVILAPPVTSTTHTIKKEKDKDGNTIGYEFDPNGSVVPISLTSATITSNMIQEANYRKVIADVNASQSIVEALSDDELANLEQMLVAKGCEFELPATVQTETKEQAKVKKLAE